MKSSLLISFGRALRRPDPRGLPLAVREHQVLLQPERPHGARPHAGADVLARPRELRYEAPAALRGRRLARLHADAGQAAGALLPRRGQRRPPRLHDRRLRLELAARPLHLRVAGDRRHLPQPDRPRPLPLPPVLPGLVTRPAPDARERLAGRPRATALRAPRVVRRAGARHRAALLRWALPLAVAACAVAVSVPGARGHALYGDEVA